jgi:hypothetical protein
LAGVRGAVSEPVFEGAGAGTGVVVWGSRSGLFPVLMKTPAAMTIASTTTRGLARERLRTVKKSLRYATPIKGLLHRSYKEKL